MKITRAMELVAAARILKAQQRVEHSRPYSDLIAQMLGDLSRTRGLTHPLLQEREARTAAVLLLASDRGLVGPYNANVLRAGEGLLRELEERGLTTSLYLVGRKSAAFFRFRQRPAAQAWAGFSDAPTYAHAKEIAATLLAANGQGEADELYCVFTNFVSSFVQRPVVRRLVPLTLDEEESSERSVPDYEFEPDADTVLESLVPRYVEVRIFAALLEASASEQAARRKAMNAATENAKKMVTSLTQEFNGARQSEITQEIMEIVGGAEAFRKTGSDG